MRAAPHALRAVLPPPVVLVAAALLFCVSLSWAVLTPVTRAPDELQHLNSILRLAEGGGWPQPGDARVHEDLVAVSELSGATSDGALSYLPGSVNTVPGAPLFAEIPPTPVDDRESFAELDDDRPSSLLDQMTQHPPGYYAATALVYRLAGLADLRYDRAVFVLRALTALTVAASVPVCCYLATRELLGNETAGRVAAFMPLGVPQLGFLAGTVTNDGAAIACTSVLSVLTLRVVTRGAIRRRLLLLAVVAGLLCWTKATALTLLPMVPLAITIASWRARGPGWRSWAGPAVRAGAGVSALAFVLGGWWWALNLVRYGSVQPSAGVTEPGTVPVLGLWNYLQVFWTRVSASYFGDIGLLEAPFPRFFTAAMAGAFLTLVLVGLSSRRAAGERIVLLVPLALTALAMFVTVYAVHRRTNALPGLQGRYLFVVLVPTVALLVAGLARVVAVLRLRWVWVLPAVVAGGLGTAGLGLLRGFRTYYQPATGSWGAALDRFLGWSPWSPAAIGVFAVPAAGCLVLLGWLWGSAAAAGDGPSPALHLPMAG